MTVNQDELRSQLDELKAKRDAILANPKLYATQRANEIAQVLTKIPQRQVTHPGNISMHDHLQALRAEYEQERRTGGRVDREVARMGNDIARLEAELNGN